MAEKYPHPQRILFDGYGIVTSKRYLNPREVKELLSDEVAITEKIDGNRMGIGHKNGKVILRGKSSRIPENNVEEKKWGRVWQWSYSHMEIIQNIPGNVTVWGEWVRAKHNIAYNKLPCYFVAFDVQMWDGDRLKLLPHHKAFGLLREWGIPTVPVLFMGKIAKKKIPMVVEGRDSAFGDEHMEGCVIKNYREQMLGKFVTREFYDGFDVHWQGRPFERNRTICEICENIH